MNHRKTADDNINEQSDMDERVNSRKSSLQRAQKTRTEENAGNGVTVSVGIKCLQFDEIYTIEPEFEAIRGHKSAHSLATGPETAEPFISPLLLTMTPALSSK